MAEQEKELSATEKVQKAIQDAIKIATEKSQEEKGRSLKSDELEDIIRLAFKKYKFGMDNLDQTVIDFIRAGQGMKITMVIPEVGTVTAPKEGVSPMILKLIDDALMGNNIFLIGEAGTGKTVLAKLLAEVLQKKYYTINSSQYTSPIEILGGQTLEGYQEGKLILAWGNKDAEINPQDGVIEGGVLILDEMPKLEPNTAGLLNDALSSAKDIEKRQVILNGRNRRFQKNGFVCIATGNIYPNKEAVEYIANFKQDLSLLDRFSGSVYYIGADHDLEKNIITYYNTRPTYEFIWEYSNKLRTEIINQKYQALAIVSLRTMINFRDVFHLMVEKIVNRQKAYQDNDAEKMKEYELSLQKGKTLIDAYSSYFLAFSEMQRENLKKSVDYTSESLKMFSKLAETVNYIAEEKGIPKITQSEISQIMSKI